MLIKLLPLPISMAFFSLEKMRCFCLFPEYLLLKVILEFALGLPKLLRFMIHLKVSCFHF